MLRALTSFDRATIQPSLLESTTTGTFFSLWLKARSHETKKLLQSMSANNDMVLVVCETGYKLKGIRYRQF